MYTTFEDIGAGETVEVVTYQIDAGVSLRILNKVEAVLSVAGVEFNMAWNHETENALQSYETISAKQLFAIIGRSAL